MNVGVMRQGLPPGVQDGNHPSLGTEILAIGGDQADRLCRGFEDDVVDDCLVLQGDGGDRGRHRKDEMEIRDRQQVDAAIGHPLSARQALTLRAVPVATAVIGDANEATVIASLDMAAERGGAANLDGGHNAPLVG